MNVHCFNCKKEFKSSLVNTKILGPQVEVKCPFCLDIYEGKLLRYIEKQLGGYRVLSCQDAAKMQSLAQIIEINSSEYYKETGLRHGKNKIRNVRNRR